MKAMRMHQAGGPDQLRYEDAPDPQVQPGQVQIRVRGAGINPSDLSRMAGDLQPLTFPYIPGIDVFGDIEAVGSGVTGLKPGDLVFGRASSGGYAQKTCLAAIEAIPLPSNLSVAEGAAIPIAFYTAYNVVHRKGRPKAGETVLISGGGGGVGVAAIQLAKLAGAQVITTVGSQEKAERVRALGADLAINYRQQDFVAEVNKFTRGKGVDLIIENAAADNFARDFEALGLDGRIVLVGTGTGKAPEAKFGVRGALMKEATIYATRLSNAGPAIREMAEAIADLLTAGQLQVIVSKSYPLIEAVEALTDLVAGRVFGKLVLTP
jgi:NADPH2:quinone reductase